MEVAKRPKTWHHKKSGNTRKIRKLVGGRAQCEVSFTEIRLWSKQLKFTQTQISNLLVPFQFCLISFFFFVPLIISQYCILYKFFKDYANYRQKINRAVGFSHIPFSNILKYRDNRENLRTIYEARFLQTHIEEFS